MDAESVVWIAQEALLLVLVISGPAVLVALVIGLVIALFQAATQLQEQTLTIAPKIVAVYLILLMTGTFMIRELASFAVTLFEQIPVVAR
jgi:flagellar biosynthetic protein FliQ